jgi:protoporphyrinogen oxidase
MEPHSGLDEAGTKARPGKHVIVVGAGPAGLASAYELSKHGIPTTVLEQADKVGGISCTAIYKGYYFDMGGHRFFTKSEEARSVWHAVLGEDLLRRPRLSRIYYNRKFFSYPLKPMNALSQMGIWQSILIVLSFLKWQLFPYAHEDSFEQWVTNRFGQRLFNTFFKTYTEKVWGISCSELRAEFAAQRIKDLSLKTAAISMFTTPKKVIKTLIEEFHYPRQGPGMMWNAVRSEIERCNNQVLLNSQVVSIHRTGNHIDSVVMARDGIEEEIHGTHLISSMPLAELIKKLQPVPSAVLGAAESLKYRDFLTVCLVIGTAELFPDNWIYIHSPDVRVGRVQNFKNWSPDMVPDHTKTTLGLEYFCNEGDDLWCMPDAALIELAKGELERIGLAHIADVEDGCVFRIRKAYPVYDCTYREALAIIRPFVDGLENLQTIGRNGLHRYDNQDHAMMTGILAARNVALGERNDVWAINTDLEYQEEMSPDGTGRQAEASILLNRELSRVFSKLDPIAFGVAVGLAAGLVLLVATLALVIKGGDVVGPTLGLLSQYFPGYGVTAAGSIVGLVYAFAAGSFCGWLFAAARNLAMLLTVKILQRSAEVNLLDIVW